jgi:D-alanine--poly(phosphoribitol) ligase subunit 2
MDQRERIESAVLRALAEVNRQLPEEEKVPLTADVPLFGGEGRLDSLGLVNLVVETEIQIQREFGLAVALADEKALSQSRSPFRTVESLVEYVGSVLRNSARV